MAPQPGRNYSGAQDSLQLGAGSFLPSLHPDVLHCPGPTLYQRKEPRPVTQDSQKSNTTEMEMRKPVCWELTLSLCSCPTTTDSQQALFQGQGSP